MKKKKSMAGFTILLTFGSWGGIKGYVGAYSARICLGFVALQLVFRNFENAIEICMDNKDNQIKKLKNQLHHDQSNQNHP